MRAPIFVEPVNETNSTSGWITKGSPQSGPVPKTKLTTPGGNSAWTISSASLKAVKEVTSEGLATHVFPNAIAGAIFHVSK